MKLLATSINSSDSSTPVKLAPNLDNGSLAIPPPQPKLKYCPLNNLLFSFILKCSSILSL